MSALRTLEPLRLTHTLGRRTNGYGRKLIRRCSNPKCFLVLERDDHLCPGCGYEVEPEPGWLVKLEEFTDRFNAILAVVLFAFVIVMEFEAINAWVNDWLDSL